MGAGGSAELCAAARRGDLQQVTTLLARDGFFRVNVNHKDHDGWTALHHAAIDGHVVVAEALLARGASMNETDHFGNIALVQAASGGHLAVVKAMLARGASVNDKGMHGWAALQCAAGCGSVPMVRALLARGADVHSTDIYGNTPLHDAASTDHESAALALWHAGADPLQRSNYGHTPLSLLPLWSGAAEQMRAAQRLTELHRLWLHAKASVITPQQLLAALKREHIHSLPDFVLAHHLLLLAVRQRVLTRTQLASFGGSRNYLLENVYLPGISRSSWSLEDGYFLTDGLRFWLSGLLSYAEKRRFVSDGNAVLVKTVADLRSHMRSEICEARLEMQSYLVCVASEISGSWYRVGAFEAWTEEASQSFKHLCEGQQQMLYNMKAMAASLQELHAMLQEQQCDRTIAGVLSFCFAMIAVVGSDRAGTSSAATESPFGVSVEHVASAGTSSVNEILAVDMSDMQTVSVLTSDQYISKLDPAARKRVEAVVQQTDFKTLPNLQRRLTVVVEELKRSDVFDEPEDDDTETELHQRFSFLASGSQSGEQTVTAQDAMSELQQILRRHLCKSDADAVLRGDVEDVVFEEMDHGTGLLDEDAFIRSFHKLQKKYPAARRPPPELRQRFRNATRSKKVLETRLAKLLLHALFKASGGKSSSSQENLSFTRTRSEWNDTQVDEMLRNHSPAEKVIDEDGFVAVGMKVLFV